LRDVYIDITEDIEGCTHAVVYSEIADGVEGEDYEYLGGERKYVKNVGWDEGSGMVMQHFWYYPNSFDVWNKWEGEGGGEGRGSPELESPSVMSVNYDAGVGPYVVCCRFVRDMNHFREVGDEEDYVVRLEDGAVVEAEVGRVMERMWREGEEGEKEERKGRGGRKEERGGDMKAR